MKDEVLFLIIDNKHKTSGKERVGRLNENNNQDDSYGDDINAAVSII